MSDFLKILLEYLLVLSLGCLIGWRSTVSSVKDKRIDAQEKITKLLEKHPVTYKDEFAFGYNIGLLDCNRIMIGIR